MSSSQKFQCNFITDARKQKCKYELQFFFLESLFTTIFLEIAYFFVEKHILDVPTIWS